MFVCGGFGGIRQMNWFSMQDWSAWKQLADVKGAASIYPIDQCLIMRCSKKFDGKMPIEFVNPKALTQETLLLFDSDLESWDDEKQIEDDMKRTEDFILLVTSKQSFS